MTRQVERRREGTAWRGGSCEWKGGVGVNNGECMGEKRGKWVRDVGEERGQGESYGSVILQANIQTQWVRQNTR